MLKVKQLTIRTGFMVLAALVMILANSFVPTQVSAAAPPSLGSAESFAVLGASAVTNTGPSVITGDLGISPNNASSVTGFPPGSYTGALYAADGVALQAQNDVTTTYNDLAGRPYTVDLTGQDLTGLTLTSGVYFFSSSAQLSGTLTLDAQNDANSVFIFQIGSTLTTASGSSVVVTNAPANFCNKWWKVGSSATLGTNSTFQGNIVALQSITLTTGANLIGRALARNGAVTMDNNRITPPLCGSSIPTTGTLEIFKFNDLNGNGVYNPPTETPLANWTYSISGPDHYSSSGSTDAAGLLTRTDLAPGDYTVTETIQTGWILTTPSPQTGTVTAGSVKKLNFGNLQTTPGTPGTGILEIFKYNDLDGNGVYDPSTEAPIASWNFTITGPNSYSSSGDTDADGFVIKNGLEPGSYTVTETGQAGWTVTTANPQIGGVPADSGSRLNFGNTQSPVQASTLEIFKFNDLNGNGVYDSSEDTPLPNWHYTITGPDGYSSFDITDGSGLITKSGLAAGDYVVTETVQVGWTVTTANPQTGTVSDSIGDRLYFGNQQPGILQVFKFFDMNGNGVYDPEDVPLADWYYTITGPGGYFSDGYTDALGLFTETSLAGLVPGDYTVTETVQYGWTVTTANPQIGTVSAGGQERLNFGNRPPNAAGGEVHPVNQVKLMIPWIVLITALLAGAIIVAGRQLRRKS